MIEKRWAANEEAPLTRDQQIELMKTAKARHDDRIERFKQIKYDEGIRNE